MQVPQRNLNKCKEILQIAFVHARTISNEESRDEGITNEAISLRSSSWRPSYERDRQFKVKTSQFAGREGRRERSNGKSKFPGCLPRSMRVEGLVIAQSRWKEWRGC